MIERTVLKSGKVRWRVRYRTPDARQRRATFDRKSDAEAFLDDLRSRVRRGDFVDPQRGRIKLRGLWDEFETSGMGHLRETTRQNYRMASRNILSHFGAWPITKIEHADVAAWVTELSKIKGPETVRYAHRVLCLLLDYGMRTRRLTSNPARGVSLPRRPPARDRILTMPEVEALTDRLGDEGDLVLTMALLGLRWSELAGLKVSDVDLTRSRVRVVERATEVAGKMDISAPKSRASARTIAIPPSLRPAMGQRVIGHSPQSLVFPAPDGGYLRNGNWCQGPLVSAQRRS